MGYFYIYPHTFFFSHTFTLSVVFTKSMEFYVQKNNKCYFHIEIKRMRKRAERRGPHQESDLSPLCCPQQDRVKETNVPVSSEAYTSLHHESCESTPRHCCPCPAGHRNAPPALQELPGFLKPVKASSASCPSLLPPPSFLLGSYF